MIYSKYLTFLLKHLVSDQWIFFPNVAESLSLFIFDQSQAQPRTCKITLNTCSTFVYFFPPHVFLTFSPQIFPFLNERLIWTATERVCNSILGAFCRSKIVTWYFQCANRYLNVCQESIVFARQKERWINELCISVKCLIKITIFIRLPREKPEAVFHYLPNELTLFVLRLSRFACIFNSVAQDSSESENTRKNSFQSNQIEHMFVIVLSN